ncbi:MAG: hypothetical protein JNK78_03185 [Planctomycetes bacterium]|nr:hypothetical protein [Planctomycetota bacterium]
MTACSQGARALVPFFVSFFVALGGEPARGQQLPEGFRHEASPLPLAASTVFVRSNGDVVTFDGRHLVLAATGQPARVLLILPTTAFGSFVIEPSLGTLVFGENSNGGVWVVPIAGPRPRTPKFRLALNYDAAVLDATHVVVSAKTTGWTTPDNEVFVLDLTTGAQSLVATLPGPSGPVAVDDGGSVYYATASAPFSTPPVPSTVLRFPHTAITNAILLQTPLTTADAQLVATGIDAAADLAFDDRGNLLFSDWFQNTIGVVLDATGPTPSLGTPLVSYGLAPGAASLHFVKSTGRAVFQPFQPVGATLFVHETDYFSASQLAIVRPARPTLTASAPSPVPAGAFAFTIDGGPALGLGVLAIASAANTAEGAFDLGFAQPLHWSLALGPASMLLPMAFDAAGHALVAANNPGFQPAITTTAQAAFLSSTNALGSTNPAVTTLGP